jgi:hypothetical protein
MRLLSSLLFIWTIDSFLLVLKHPPFLEVPHGVHVIFTSHTSPVGTWFKGFEGLSNNLGFLNHIMWFVHHHKFTYILPSEIHYTSHGLGSSSLFHRDASDPHLIEFPSSAWSTCISKHIVHYTIGHPIGSAAFSNYWHGTVLKVLHKGNQGNHTKKKFKYNTCLVLNINSTDMIGYTTYNYSLSAEFLTRHYKLSNTELMVPEQYRNKIIIHYRLGDVANTDSYKRGQFVEIIAVAKYVFDRLGVVDKEVYLMTEGAADHPDVIILQVNW